MNFPKISGKNRDEWIMEVPVISTSHFTESDANLLYLGAFLVDQEPDHLHRVALLRLEDYNAPFGVFSPTIVALTEHFSGLGYVYIRIDPEGDKVEGFPVFDW